MSGTAQHELVVARGTSLEEPLAVSEFRKADAPELGDKHGVWGNEYESYRLPGGSVLNFDLSRLTLSDYRAMRENYQINASLLILLGMLAQADFSIYTKGQETDAAARKISDTLEEGIRKQWMPLIRALGQSHWAGYSPIVKVFDLNKQSKYYEITKYKDLVPEDSRVNWEKKRFRDGTEIRYYDGIVNGGKTIAKELTLWYPVLMENGNHYGRKLLKPAFAPWFFSQLIHLFTNRYYERFGDPTVLGYYPPGDTITDAEGVAKPSRDVMLETLANLRSRGVVALPSDREPDSDNLEWEIKFLESQMRGADFERYLDRLDEEMTLALFTPVLMFRTGDRGSFNLGQIHERVFSWMINMLVTDVKYYLDNYVVTPLHDINFGPNAPASEIRFRTLGRLSDQGAQSALQALIQNGGAKLSTLGVKDLGDFLGIDLEYLSGTATAPTASPAPADPADPNGPQASPNDPAKSPNARQQLARARARLEEQVAGLFDRHSGHDLERELNRVRLGFRGAYLSAALADGADEGTAASAFNELERGVRVAITSAESKSDAIEAVTDAYRAAGFDS